MAEILIAVLLVHADAGMARPIAGRMESALHQEREEPPLTVSIGFSVYPDNGRTAQQLSRPQINASITARERRGAAASPPDRSPR
jgi:GGDEF domain-containing protein